MKALDRMALEENRICTLLDQRVGRIFCDGDPVALGPGISPPATLPLASDR